MITSQVDQVGLKQSICKRKLGFWHTLPHLEQRQSHGMPCTAMHPPLPCRDFIVQVVRKPVVVAGNSIGGFVSTSMAADNPTLVSRPCKGLALALPHVPWISRAKVAADCMSVVW